MHPPSTLYARLRAENPYYPPAQALSLARTALRATAAGFRVTRLGVEWGGALWQHRNRRAWANNQNHRAYRVAVVLANAINHRDNVTGWMREESWFGGYSTASAAPAVARGTALMARKRQPMWLGEEGVYVDVARAVDATLAWCAHG